jgi:hypothetical protein
MVRTALAGIGLAACVASGGAGAMDAGAYDLDSARDLLDVCAPADGDPDADAALAFCYGYISGTGEFYIEMVKAEAIDRMACADPVPSLHEIRMAFVDWARANPGELAAGPGHTFWKAMSVAYPCQ